jgi:hypothetical protein
MMDGWWRSHEDPNARNGDVFTDLGSSRRNGNNQSEIWTLDSQPILWRKGHGSKLRGVCVSRRPDTASGPDPRKAHKLSLIRRLGAPEFTSCSVPSRQASLNMGGCCWPSDFERDGPPGSYGSILLQNTLPVVGVSASAMPAALSTLQLRLSSFHLELFASS